MRLRGPGLHLGGPALPALLVGGLNLYVGHAVLVGVLHQAPLVLVLLHSRLDDAGVDVVDGDVLRAGFQLQQTPGTGDAAEV